MAKLISMVAVALVAAGLLIAGCGGGDSLSTAELAKEANAICLKVNDKNYKGFQALVVKNASAFSNSPSSPAVQAVLGEGVTTITVPVLKKATEELEALDASSDDKENVEALTAELKEATEAAEKDPDSKLATSGLLYNDVHKQARAAGFKNCTAIP